MKIPDDLIIPAVVDFVLDRPKLVYGVVGAISILAALVVSQAVLGSSVGKLFFGESPAYLAYLEENHAIGSDVQILIGLEDLDPLSEADIAKVESIMGALEEVALPVSVSPGLKRPIDDLDGFEDEADLATEAGEPTVGIIQTVHGLPRALRFVHSDSALSAKSYQEILTQEGKAAALKTLDLFDADSTVGGLLITKDRSALAIIAELYEDKERPAEAVTRINQQVEQILRDHGVDPMTARRAGLPGLLGEMLRSTHYNMQRILPFVVCVMLLTIFVLFRQLWPAVIAGIVSLLGVLWSMAISVSIDRELSIMHTLMPMVIIIVASSDVIHIISAYRIELQRGLAKRLAIRQAASEVGRACLYTSMTTFVGFAALSFVPTPVFRQLGVVLGAGVGIALFLAVTLVPPLLERLPEPPSQKADFGGPLVKWLLERSCTLSTTKPYVVLGLFTVLTLGACYGLTQLHIENQWTGRIAQDNKYVVDQKWFEANFTKGTVLQLLIDTQKPGGLLEPGFLKKLDHLEHAIREDSRVDAVFSVNDAIRKLDGQLRGGAGTVPADGPTIAQYMLSLETLGPGALKGFVDFERSKAMLSIRIEESLIRKLAVAGDELTEMARKALKEEATIRPTGILYLIGDWLTEILKGQRRGLIFSFLVIALMMMLALRSFRDGLLSMVPNFLPLLMIGGLFGLLYEHTDSDALVLGMLAIGIGVDDTIHFMMRFRLEMENGLSIEQAIRRTYKYAGRGILITTLVLALGFAPLALSDYWSIMIIGIYLPLTLVFALLADILLVPALATVGAFRLRAFTGEQSQTRTQ